MTSPVLTGSHRSIRRWGGPLALPPQVTAPREHFEGKYASTDSDPL